MGRRADLIAKYADVLRSRCGVEPDMALLERVAIGCGPAIYDPEGEVVDPGDAEALRVVQSNFLVRKLALRESRDLSDALDAMLAVAGAQDGPVYRAVLYYLLTRHFGREAAYGYDPAGA